MKAVRSTEGGVSVVDLEEPPGFGEKVTITSASICGSDLGYIEFGSRSILGHELAGHREDGTAVVGAGSLDPLAVAGARQQGATDIALKHAIHISARPVSASASGQTRSGRIQADSPTDDERVSTSSDWYWLPRCRIV